MKKIVIPLVLIVVVLAIFTAAGPFITIHNIKSGVEQQDSEKLTENIDFPTLRSNLKEQFNAFVMKNAASELQDNPFAALAMGFASKMVEGMVDSFITPSGLRSVIDGKNPKQAKGSGNLSQEPNRQQPGLFKDARYTFDSVKKCSVWVKNDKGGEIRFVLLRDGLSWKLSNIVFSEDDVKYYGRRFTGSEDRENNSMAKRDIKAVFVAAWAFFSEKPKGILTQEILIKYGFEPSEGVKISIHNGIFANLRITSKHEQGSKTYFMGPSGAITEY